MLNLRIDFLKDKVDNFIIIEFEQDFLLNKKENLLNLQDIEVDEDRVTHLKIPHLTENQVIEFLKTRKIKKIILDFEKNGFTKEILLQIGFLILSDFILGQDFLLNDLILISDVDEIPDLSNLQEITEKLIYGPVFFKQKNFIWSDKFVFQTKHVGSILFDYSQIVSNNQNFYYSYKSKNMLKGTKNNFHSGWHLSHFYDLDRTMNKLKLLYPEKRIERVEILESIKNLQNPIVSTFGVHEKLIENHDKLPFVTHNLPKQYLGRKNIKKILVTIFKNKNHNPQNWDKVLEISNHVKFLPKKPLYENNSGQDYGKIFLMNEIPKILESEFLLNQDLVFIILSENFCFSETKISSQFVDEEKKFAVFDWKTIKSNIVSDLIY